MGSVAMAAFKVGNQRVFHLLGNQEFEPAEAFAFLTDLLDGSHIDWWFTLFLTGGGLKMGKEETAAEVMIKVGLIEESSESAHLSHMGQWREGWGHSSGNRFAEIRQNIEQILQWK